MVVTKEINKEDVFNLLSNKKKKKESKNSYSLRGYESRRHQFISYQSKRPLKK